LQAYCGTPGWLRKKKYIREKLAVQSPALSKIDMKNTLSKDQRPYLGQFPHS
jgi:hypothetical protein